MNCNYLRKDADFVRFIKDKIKDLKKINLENSVCNPNSIWDAFKCTISGYCIEYTSRKKKERITSKKNLMKQIEGIQLKLAGGLDDDVCVALTDELKDLESLLDKIVDFETDGLITRSRRWAEEGERSSKYFCNLEKRANERKSINRIRTASQTVITDKKNILEEIRTFYCNLYQYSNVEKSCNDYDVTVHNFLDSLDIPKLSVGEKLSLDQPISKHEVFQTISSMNHNKSPGYDGIPVEFYIVFWNDISDMLLDSLNYSFENGRLSLSQRNGIITLLPKKDRDLLEIQNYRPISLLTVDYKIIAESLRVCV